MMSGAGRLIKNSGGVGATITGMDLSKPMDEPVRTRLRDWLARYHVLAFRDQRLDPAAQIRVMRAFGKVIDEARDGLFYSAVTAKADSMVKPGRLLFHLDNHFTPEPLEVLSLYGEQVDPGGAPTLFADNVQAMARLPVELARRIEGVEALNVSYYFWGQGGARSLRRVVVGDKSFDDQFTLPARIIAAR